VANAFAPVLATQGGGTLLNIISTAAWASVPTGYGASKAALWAATNALRFALLGQGTQTIALLVGMIDTRMSARWDVPKVTPARVVAQAYDAVVDGLIEVLADDEARALKAQLSTKAEDFYPWLHEQLASFAA
jgi:short-subunit dehydrogenase